MKRRLCGWRIVLVAYSNVTRVSVYVGVIVSFGLSVIVDSAGTYVVVQNTGKASLRPELRHVGKCVFGGGGVGAVVRRS